MRKNPSERATSRVYYKKSILQISMSYLKNKDEKEKIEKELRAAEEKKDGANSSKITRMQKKKI